ncbi:MAG: PQQ-binding-like beta-propeller repeat protein, partial [Planctomycetia bacterium]
APKAGFAAFDLNTGKALWTSGDDTAGYAAPVLGETAAGRRLYFFARSGLHALDPADGAPLYFQRWRPRIDASVNAATPVVVGDEVFVSTSYGTGGIVVAPDGAGGVRKVWSSPTALACHFSTPVYTDGRLFGIDGRQEGGARLRCVDWKTGKVLWTEEGFGAAHLILADGVFYALRDDGRLTLFDADPSAYKPRGTITTADGPTRAFPALADGRLYVRGPAELVAVDLRAK